MESRKSSRVHALKALELLSRLQEINDSDSDAGAEEDDEFDDVDDDDVDFEPNEGLQEEEFDEDSDGEAEEVGCIDETISEVITATMSSIGLRPELDPDFDTDIDTTAKDKTIWCKMKASTQTKYRNRIAFNEKYGPTCYAKNHIDHSALSAFFCIFCSSMLRMIVDHTNNYADMLFQQGEISEEFKTTKDEMLNFIGVLYCRGIFCSKTPIKSMWSRMYGLPIISKLISRNRFLKIMRYIRFDDKSKRKTTTNENSFDKFKLARSPWERFIENCRACYLPSQFLTVDEQLLPTRCRCAFLQFMANKPDKFGIKFWLLVDLDSKYVLNGFPYLGANTDKPEKGELQGEFIVKKLVAPYFNRGHCITTDNFFTTFRLSSDLLKKKTTLIGTLKSDKQQLPLIAKAKQQPLYSSLFFEHNSGCMITVYQTKVKPQKKKCYNSKFAS